jgi:chromosome segregation ATPase
MSAFLLRYLDQHFARLESQFMSSLESLKAEVAGLRADLDAADGRDGEDLAELRRLLDEKTAQLNAADADAATLLPEIQALRDRVQKHDLDPSFPATAGGDVGGGTGTDGGTPPPAP